MTTRRRKIRNITLAILAVIIVALVAARIYLPVYVLQYVNKQLNNIPGYKGEVQDISIHLYRGAYTIHGLEIRKMDGKIPVPFVAIENTDLSVEWGALLEGRVVAKIILDHPNLNFAKDPNGKTQTGKGVDWTDHVKKLLPVDINRIDIHEGHLAYRDFSTTPKVNLFIDHMEGNVQNLQNVTDKSQPMPSTVDVTGDSIGHGKLHIQGRMNVLSNPLEMQMRMALEGVNLPALNEYFKAFASINVEKGEFNLYTVLNVHQGRVSGYIKPMFIHMEILSMEHADNPFQFAWEALVSGVITLFTNQKHDQFATVIPVSGELKSIETHNWAAIIGIIDNAFIEALKKGLSAKSPDKANADETK